MGLPWKQPMNFSRRALLALAPLCLVAACAAPVRVAEKPPSTAFVPTGAAPPGNAAAVPPGNLSAIKGDEDAERMRQTLDALFENDPARPALFRALLDYYVEQAKVALLRKQSEEAYQSFETALTLFAVSDLQNLPPPPVAPDLLTVARQLDRIYSRRGAHPQVITAMMVQMTLQPSDPELQRRYAEISAWLNSQNEGLPSLMRGRGGTLSNLLAAPPPTLQFDLEQTYKVWPVPKIRDELVAIYRADAAGSMTGGKKSSKDFLQSLSASLRRKGLTNGPAFKIARLYLRVSKPQEAVAAIKQLARLSAEDAKLLALLEETLGRPAGPGETEERLVPAIKLAMSMAQNPEDIEVSLQICQDIARRAPNLPSAHTCVGELALVMEKKGLALTAFERVRALLPGERGVWDMVGRLYVDKLSDLVIDERTAYLEDALKQVEAFYQSMRKQFPQNPPTAGIAVALAEVGRGYYNAGRIADALRYLERSIAVEPNALALEQLGILLLRRGEYERAAQTLERARAVFTANQQADPSARMLFFARMGRLVAEALEMHPQLAVKRQAAEVRERTLRQFEQLLDSNRLSSSRAGEAEIERGKLLYENGQREQALEAFRRAADATGADEPQGRSQGQPYVDMMAFLIPRGEIEESVSMYHRALGRVRLSEAMKVYTSLWVSDILARAGQPADPLTEAVFAAVQGGKWPTDLARWANGRLSESELLIRADTPGKQAEANFYLGMAHLRAGERPQAEACWRKVLETQMFGYFEYEMASLYLRQKGAPTAPVPAVTVPASTRATPSVRTPAGSI